MLHAIRGVDVDDVTSDISSVLGRKHGPREHQFSPRVNWALEATCEVHDPNVLDARAEVIAEVAPMDCESLGVPKELRRVVLNGNDERDFEGSLFADWIRPARV